MPFKPNRRTVVLDGTNPSQAVQIPRGTRKVDINPRTTTVDVNVSFSLQEVQTNNDSIRLLDGQSYTFDFGDHPNGTPEDLELFFFASAAVDVDVVWY